jgi:predicted AAA+ superfamily ATPase
MNFNRHISSSLLKWKTSINRKPLILRGARQVGKTTLVKKFATSYDFSIILNLEKPEHLQYFENFTDVKTILESLLLRYQIPSAAVNKTLLFIDEIQESPKAIHLLRYFYEELPELHVISAGSLLEFALRHVKSFPVGRVEFLYLHPLNFQEYLQAIGHESALEQLHQIPIKPFAHTVLMDLFHQYAIIGGMPEVIKNFIQTKSMADLPKIYESLWSTYQNDVEKYARNETDRRVTKHIISNAHLSIDQRIKLQNFGNSNYRSREVGESFRNLDDAKIIQLIYPTTDTEIPIKSDHKKSPRLQFLDTGLLNHSLNIQATMLSLKDLSATYKGAIIPHLITQETISLQNLSYHKPNFWVREKKQSNSEIDLVLTYKDKVIPFEIKSGSTGTLRSLHQFIDVANHAYAIRIYGSAFNIENATTPSGKPYILMSLPYYLGTKLPEYMEWFVENYPI